MKLPPGALIARNRSNGKLAHDRRSPDGQPVAGVVATHVQEARFGVTVSDAGPPAAGA
jgi:hypothetical protein